MYIHNIFKYHNMTSHSDFGTIDATNPKIIIITLHEIDPSLEQAIEFSNIRDDVFKAAKENFILIIDAKKLKWVNTRARIELAKRAKVIQEIVKEEKLTIIIAPNLILKTILKLFNSITRTEIPQETCSSMEEASKLANKKISEIL